MRTRKPGISNILAAMILISLAVAGVGIYFVVLKGFVKPQPGISASISVTRQGSGFIIVSGTITNTGSLPFSSLLISVTDQSSNTLQISYSAPVSANGGTLSFTVGGYGGSGFTVIQGGVSVSGTINPQPATFCTSIVTAKLSNGGTFNQGLKVYVSS